MAFLFQNIGLISLFYATTLSRVLNILEANTWNTRLPQFVLRNRVAVRLLHYACPAEFKMCTRTSLSFTVILCTDCHGNCVVSTKALACILVLHPDVPRSSDTFMDIPGSIDIFILYSPAHWPLWSPVNCTHNSKIRNDSALESSIYTSRSWCLCPRAGLWIWVSCVC